VIQISTTRGGNLLRDVPPNTRRGVSEISDNCAPNTCWRTYPCKAFHRLRLSGASRFRLTGSSAASYHAAIVLGYSLAPGHF